MTKYIFYKVRKRGLWRKSDKKGEREEEKEGKKIKE